MTRHFCHTHQKARILESFINDATGESMDAIERQDKIDAERWRRYLEWRSQYGSALAAAELIKFVDVILKDKENK